MNLKIGVFFVLFLVVFISSCQGTDRLYTTDENDYQENLDDSGDVLIEDNSQDSTYTNNGDYTSEDNVYETQQEDIVTEHEELGENTGCYWDVLWDKLVELSDQDASDEEIYIAMCDINCAELNPSSYQCPY